MTPSNYKPTRYPNVHRRGDVLYFRYRDEHGRPRTKKYGWGRPVDASRAQQKAQELADQIRVGLTTRSKSETDELGRLPIAEHIESYKRSMRAMRLTSKHIKETIRCVDAAVLGCRFKTLASVNARRFTAFLHAGLERGWSSRTHNIYRTRFMGFLNWSVRQGIIQFNPLDKLIPTMPEHSDKRKPSRAMSVDEFQKLIDHLPNTPEGKHRRAVYTLSVMTGLRFGEISRIRSGDIDLKDRVLTLWWGRTKNKRRADLPLPAPCVAVLSDLRAGQPYPLAPVPILRTWKADVKRAGLVYETSRGQFNRKCLRMTFCTWLAHSGVDVRIAQRLMRHANANLTSTIYTDLLLVDLAKASEAVRAHYARGAAPTATNRTKTKQAKGAGNARKTA